MSSGIFKTFFSSCPNIFFFVTNGLSWYVAVFCFWWCTCYQCVVTVTSCSISSGKNGSLCMISSCNANQTFPCCYYKVIIKECVIVIVAPLVTVVQFHTVATICIVLWCLEGFHSSFNHFKVARPQRSEFKMALCSSYLGRCMLGIITQLCTLRREPTSPSCSDHEKRMPNRIRHATVSFLTPTVCAPEF